MPIVSERMRRAMYAAKEGKSTLGIPKSVGKEFVATDKPGRLPENAGGSERRRKALYTRKR